jgi:hypothetical protein
MLPIAMLYLIIQETDFKSNELLVSIVFCPLNPPKGGLGSMIIYLILNVLRLPFRGGWEGQNEWNSTITYHHTRLLHEI